MNDIRVGLIGSGHAARHHAAAIDQIEGLELCAVAARRLEDSKEFCSALGSSARPVAIEEVLHSPTIDAIIIAVPGAVQPKLAIAAFDAGKHVLCEKPLAVSVEEARRVEHAWVSAQTIGMVNFCYRLVPELQEFKRLLSNGACGQIGLLQVDWVLASRTQPGLTANWKAYSESGGGVLNNYGVHVIDYLFHDCENVEVVAARTGSLFSTRFDDQGVIRPVSGEERAVVVFDVGYPVIVNLSLVTEPALGHRVMAYGSAGTLELSNRASDSPAGPFSVRWSGASDAVTPEHRNSSASLAREQHGLVSLFRRTTALFAHAIRSNHGAYALSIGDGVKAARLVARSKELANGARPIKRQCQFGGDAMH